MTSVTDTIPTYKTLNEVPADVADCWIDGVLYHRCGAGRKQNRKNAIAPCGELKPHTTPHYWYNGEYKPNAAGGRYDITCGECKTKSRPNGIKRTYTAETPRDKAIVPTRTEVVTLHGRDFAVGWHEGATYWPVKPFVEAAGLDWAGQEKRIKADARLVKGIEKMSIPTPGGAQPMLCLPWGAWHYFWSGTHSPKAERWRQEAYDALRLLFGETAGEVLQDKPVEDRIADASRHHPPALLPSDAIRKRPDLFLQYADLARAAEVQANRAKEIAAQTAAAVARAQERKAAAEREIAVAAEEEACAIAQNAAAIAEAKRTNAQLDAILDQIDALADGDTQYVYLFGKPEELGQMFVDGKVGDTRNKAQRRKQLRDGIAQRDWLVTAPCEDGEQCAAIILTYLCSQGARKIGNDHFSSAPGYAISFVINTLKAMEYVTPDALRNYLTRSAA